MLAQFEEINDANTYAKLIEKDDRQNESLLILLLITEALFYGDKSLSDEQIKIVIYVYNIYKQHYKLDQAFKKRVNSLKSISQRVKDIVNADTKEST